MVNKKDFLDELGYEKNHDKNDFLFVVRTKQDGTDVLGVDIDKVSDYLIGKYNFKTIYHSKGEDCYLYEKGIWIRRGRAIIKTKTEKLLQQHAKINAVNEIFEKIKRKTEIDNEEFEKIPQGIVCLENGLFDLKERKLLDFSPEYYFKSRLPIHYDKEADCPLIKSFFNQALYDEDVEPMQEWFGFNLWNQYFLKKAAILFGERDTSKTVTMQLQSAFLGTRNIVSLSLQKIGLGKPMDLLFLKDKHANIFDDLGEKDLADKGGFKIATGGGYITGEHKFGDIIRFVTFAKLIFATNKIPAVKDQDDNAYFDRWLPFKYDNQISKKDQDPFLVQKLTSKEEISGLFNWAIEGLGRLLKNNKFTNEKTIEEKKRIMQRSSHPLTAFAQDCLEQQDGNKITKDLMFKVYSEWCSREHYARLTKEKIGRNLERFVPYILAAGGKERVWENVKFKGNVDTYDTLISNTRQIRSIEDNKKYNSIYNFENSVKSVTDEEPEIEHIDMNKMAQFTDEEIKLTGYTRKELEDIENPTISEKYEDRYNKEQKDIDNSTKQGEIQ